MAIVQISKIQVRTGAESDLPQLDIGELGFATDTRNAYIGNDPLMDPPVGIQPTLTQLLTDSPNCYINASQLIGVLNIHVTDLKIDGGTNGYVLQTDGSGNLNWSAQSGGGGGSVGGTNTQVQFNDSGVASGTSNLTFDKTSNTLTLTGNLVATNVTGNLLTASQPNITTVGTLTGLTTIANANINLGGELIITNNNQHGGSSYAGMITFTSTINDATNVNKFVRLTDSGTLEIINSEYSETIFSLTDSGNLTTNYIFGNGSQLSDIHAVSVGTLTSLTVDGITNLGTVANVKVSGGTLNQVLRTDGDGNLSWATISGTGSIYGNTEVGLYLASYTSYMANATHATIADSANSVAGSDVVGFVANATIANTVRDSSQPNITSVGTLVSLTVSGTTTLGDTVSANYFIGSGNNLSNIRAANVNGKVANSIYADSAGSATLADVATNATIVPWTGVSGKPSTVSGYNITDLWVPQRQSVSTSTLTLAAGANTTVTLSGYKTYMMYGIQATATNIWISVYSNTSSMTSDASRTSSTDPTPGTGVIAEVITKDSNMNYFTPGVIGYNNDSSVSGNIYVRITNIGSTSTTLTASLNILRLE